MKLINFKDFNRIEVSTVYQGEPIEFTIIVNLSQEVFHDVINDWLKISESRTCDSLCEYINTIEKQIAYSESDMAILIGIPDDHTKH
jgi:hypothetical protein